MPLAALCTVDDLLLELGSAHGGNSELLLAQLASDQVIPGVTTLADDDVQARLARYIEDESRAVKNRLGDSVELTDGEVADDLRRLAVVRVLYRLYCRRGAYSVPGNPFAERKKEADEELAEIRAGRLRVGSAGSQTPAPLASSTTDDLRGDARRSTAAWNRSQRDSALDLGGF